MFGRFASRTAEAVCLMRAYEHAHPAGKCVVDDPYAQWFLRPLARAALTFGGAPPNIERYADWATDGLRRFVIARHRYIDDSLVRALRRALGCYSAWGPDADRRAKRLMNQSLEGSHLGAYSQSGSEKVPEFPRFLGGSSPPPRILFPRQFHRPAPNQAAEASVAARKPHRERGYGRHDRLDLQGKLSAHGGQREVSMLPARSIGRNKRRRSVDDPDEMAREVAGLAALDSKALKQKWLAVAARDSR